MAYSCTVTKVNEKNCFADLPFLLFGDVSGNKEFFLPDDNGSFLFAGTDERHTLPYLLPLCYKHIHYALHRSIKLSETYNTLLYQPFCKVLLQKLHNSVMLLACILKRLHIMLEYRHQRGFCVIVLRFHFVRCVSSYI